jgi:geranylgeranyl pyrophosphate synthase
MMQIISEGPAIDKCHKQLDLYAHKAMKALDLFPNSVAKEILESTIIA